MSQATSSDRIQLLIAGYVLGDLSPDEAQELARLMAENSAIAAEVEALQTVSETMQDITDVPPPSHLRTRVMASSEQPESPPVSDNAIYRVATSSPPDSSASPTSPTPLPLTTPPPRQRRFWLAGGAIAAALIMGLGIDNYHLRQAAQTEIEQPTLLTYSLMSPDATNNASASVVVNPTTLEAQVTAQNLPALPPDQVYAVWTLPQPDVPATIDDKGAILTGVFQVGTDGAADTTLSVPPVHRNPEWVAKVAITVEDAISPQQHTGSVIIITQ